ncbi:ribosomal RNA-processing protein 7-domain-containing protein [Syncephalis fuscata]|nr:ribosomal RNA-processing protein 7-domain-containing protein [Syncephalis fuscata]
MANKNTSSGKKKKTKSTEKGDQSQPLAIIDGFHVLPLQVSTSHQNTTTVHYVYFKQHKLHGTSKLDDSDDNSDSNDDKHDSTHNRRYSEKDRILFVLNLPIDTTEADIRHWFRDAGVIESVRFQTIQQYNECYNITPNNDATLVNQRLRPLLDAGSYAHVVFLEPLGLQRALAMTSRTRRWRDEATAEKSKTQLAVGLERYKLAYTSTRPSSAILSKQADDYIIKHEAQERAKEANLSAMYNVPDADGFVTVVRHHRKRGNTDGRGTVKAIRAEEAAKLKEKTGQDKERVDFYRFQHREAKREKLLDLRRKFEQDKERIARMRTNRRFNPY